MYVCSVVCVSVCNWHVHDACDKKVVNMADVWEWMGVATAVVTRPIWFG